MIGALSIVVAGSTTATVAVNTCRSSLPSRGGIEPSVGSVGDSYDNALAETITVFTRPRSSTGEDRGDPLKLLSMLHSNG